MITKEQLVKNNAFVDSIDDISIKRVEAQNQCSERYAYVPSQHRTTLPDVKMGEPCFENPCSYEAVEKENATFSVSGNISKGEGGDFVVENRNRKVKKCLPSGLPTENKWLSVYRNIDRLDKVRIN
ncbi:hypothetical protein KUTeg_014553 [Tegillarca granosa]|uniref:Uncharacterized protein n=1 Tax=Tegillarca granosa TaxID=220873 RepID=A0ABQ9EU82_TEGGR|nr:hypothetical protein KUTeg_014553 [Tegillarca granosa]